MRKKNIIKFTLGCLSFVLLTSLMTSLTAQSAIDKLIGPSSLQKKGDPHWVLTNTQKGYASKGTPISKTSFETKKQYNLFNGYYKSAIYFYEIGHRVQSIPYLMQAHDMLPNNLQLNVLLGKTLCISTSTRAKSEAYLVKALQIEPNNKDALIYLGRVVLSKYFVDSAINIFTQVLALPNIDTNDRKYAEKWLKNAQYTKSRLKKPERVWVDNVGSGVNSTAGDYAPVLSSDELIMYFTSVRPGSKGGKIDPMTGFFFEDVYKATRRTNEDTVWNVENLAAVNTDGHDGSAGLSMDGQRLFVHRGIKKEGIIYTSKADGSEWDKPSMASEGKAVMTKNDHDKTVSYTFDERIMYFVSDREGGYGGYDIWYCKKDNSGKWEEPKNVGPVINTAGNDMYASIAPDGKSMYFASEGHPTMGGFDIFFTIQDSAGNWSKPTNLGWPINTVENEISFSRTLSGKNAYFSSERMPVEEGTVNKTIYSAPNYGSYDIYKITYLGEEKGVVTGSEDQLIAYITAPVGETVVEAAATIEVTPITLLKGFVFDDQTKAALGAPISMVDNDLGEEIAVFESNPKTGRFTIALPAGHNYGITVRKEGYLFHSENFDIPLADAEYNEVYKEFPLKNISVGSKVVLRNVFFEVDKYVLLPASHIELDRLVKLMTDAPTLQIEVSGHTDVTGSLAHNKTLSLNRAKAVVDYLVEHGISLDRITSAGYGPEQPVCPEDNLDCLKSMNENMIKELNKTAEQRALNRRTEFKITGNNANLQIEVAKPGN
jgi:outer membrane protein OmpA-like peptidoglycan-associated protein